MALPLAWSTNCTRTLPKPDGITFSSISRAFRSSAATFCRFDAGGGCVAIASRNERVQSPGRCAETLLSSVARPKTVNISRTNLDFAIDHMLEDLSKVTY